MSLLTGFHEDNFSSKDQPGMLKTLTKKITFKNFNVKNTVKVFDSGIILMGITTTTASSDVSVRHTGLVYYDIYNPTTTKKISDIRTSDGNHFTILNNSNKDTVNLLKSVYNVPIPCSITVRLGIGSQRVGRPKYTPANSVTLNITLYYVDITPHIFAPVSVFGDVFAIK